MPKERTRGPVAFNPLTYMGLAGSRMYASEEFEFACSVRRHAQHLWSRVSGEWPRSPVRAPRPPTPALARRVVTVMDGRDLGDGTSYQS